MQVLRPHIHADELHIVVEAHYTATLTRFDILLADVARLIIEKAVRVATPSDTSHVDPIIGLELEQ